MPNVNDDAISYLTSGITTATTVLPVEDASVFPDPVTTSGVVWVTLWEISKYREPSDDPDRERLEVSARDTGADTITIVARGAIDTAKNHNTGGSGYALAVLVDAQNSGQVQDFTSVEIGRSRTGAGSNGLAVRDPSDFPIRCESSDSYSGLILKDPNREWVIATSGFDFFITDETGDTNPIRISANAPTASFHMESDGRIGLGTASPDSLLKLHVVGALDYLAKFEATDSFGGIALEDTTQIWGIASSGGNFIIRDQPISQNVVVIEAGCVNDQIRVKPEGIMTFCPATPAANIELHTSSLHFSIDEVNDNLEIKVKKSNNVAVTGTVSLS